MGSGVNGRNSTDINRAEISLHVYVFMQTPEIKERRIPATPTWMGGIN